MRVLTECPHCHNNTVQECIMTIDEINEAVAEALVHQEQATGMLCNLRAEIRAESKRTGRMYTKAHLAVFHAADRATRLLAQMKTIQNPERSQGDQ